MAEEQLLWAERYKGRHNHILSLPGESKATVAPSVGAFDAWANLCPCTFKTGRREVRGRKDGRDLNRSLPTNVFVVITK